MSKDGKRQRGLGFQSSLQQVQMIWLPASLVDWQLLKFCSDILVLSYFAKNGYNSKLVHGQEIDSYNAALQLLHTEGKRLKQYIHDQTATQEKFQRMCQEIYRQFVIKILRDVHKNISHTETLNHVRKDWSSISTRESGTQSYNTFDVYLQKYSSMSSDI